jgi:hypothetical protein
MDFIQQIMIGCDSLQATMRRLEIGAQVTNLPHKGH